MAFSPAAAPETDHSAHVCRAQANAPWWVTRDAFPDLEFYSPKLLTGRSNGWVGIAPDGNIFVYAFTM